MLQKATVKILSASNQGDQSPGSSPSSTSSSDSQSENGCSIDSLLNDSQMEELEFAAQELKLSISSLLNHLKKALETEMLNSPSKGRRVLPLSPHERAGLASPKKNNRINIARNLNIVDLAESS